MSPLGLAFRDEAAKLGMRVHEIQDDVTDVWYREFSPGWRETPSVLAGLTLSTSLFCLETLAHDCGMRVWFRATHNYLPKGYVEHLVWGPERMVQQAAAFGPDWGPEFARLASALPLVRSRKSERRIVEPVKPPSGEPGPMVSWVIAPRLMTQSVVIA
jgi:hypothetical protein